MRFRLPLFPLEWQTNKQLGEYPHNRAGDLLFGARLEDAEGRLNFIASEDIHWDAIFFRRRPYRFEDWCAVGIPGQSRTPPLFRYDQSW